MGQKVGQAAGKETVKDTHLQQIAVSEGQKLKPQSREASLLNLQRTYGNRQVQQILKGGVLQRKCVCGQSAVAGGVCAECAKNKGGLQRKLAIGASNDPLEREADRVADRVMATPTHRAVSGAPLSIQRYTGQVAKGTDAAPASVDRVLASSGSPLAPELRQNMEQRFGHDFSGVRVHTDTAAERSAREVGAHAYTVGRNIVFGANQFLPSTCKGRWLIAHELTHVVQQSGLAKIRVGQSNENSMSPLISTLNGKIQLQRFISSEPAGGCGVCYGKPANVGKAAHTLIQTEFEILYPLGLVEFGIQSADDENGRLDLAIAVPGGFEIGEIKPANEKGYSDGITQIAKYINLISAKFPKAAIKPLTKLLPPIIFPTLSSDCPVQILFVNPPVGGVYGYFCTPSFAQLKRKGCSCPTPRKKQEEEKKETQTNPNALPQAAVKSFEQQIIDFIHEVIVGGHDVEKAVRKFLNDHREIVNNIEVIIAAIAAGAILTDIISAGAATAKDPIVAAILSAMFRIARIMRAAFPTLVPL